MEATTISQEEPGLFEKAGEYAQTQIKLLKYRAVDTGAEVVSSVISKLVVILLLVFFVAMLNIGVALWIGHMLGYTFYGFFIVAGFYGLLSLIFSAFGGKWIKLPMTDMIIRKILK